MKSEDLYKAIGNMDDQYIDDRPIVEINRTQHLRPLRTVVAVAACITLLVLIGASIWRHNQSFEIVYPSQNGNANYMEQNASWYETVYYDYAELAKTAQVIVVADVLGVVLEQASGYDETVFCSFARVSVCEVLKGDIASKDIIYVCDNGFSCVDPTMVLTYSGGPLMEKGNRVMLFLRYEEGNEMENGKKFYTFLSPFLGPFFYDEDSQYHEVLCYSDVGTERDLFPVKLTDYEPKTLEEIKQLIYKGICSNT